MGVLSHDKSLEGSDTRRRAELRQWFEHVIMVPVSVGMVTAFVVLAARHLMAAAGAPAWTSASLPSLTAVVSLGAFVFAVARWMRR